MKKLSDFFETDYDVLVKDIKIDEDLIKNTNNNLETIVKMGERIGIKSK